MVAPVLLPFSSVAAGFVGASLFWVVVSVGVGGHHSSSSRPIRRCRHRGRLRRWDCGLRRSRRRLRFRGRGRRRLFNGHRDHLNLNNLGGPVRINDRKLKLGRLPEVAVGKGGLSWCRYGQRLPFTTEADHPFGSLITLSFASLGTLDRLRSVVSPALKSLFSKYGSKASSWVSGVNRTSWLNFFHRILKCIRWASPTFMPPS